MAPLSRKPLRSALGVVTALPLALGLSGCIFSLPPAVQALSLAMDGFSFVTTGKTVTDHALSAMVEKDCALTRVLDGVAICADDAQLAELEAVERRLAPSTAERLAQTVTAAGPVEIEAAEIEKSEGGESDPADFNDLNVAAGPLY